MKKLLPFVLLAIAASGCLSWSDKPTPAGGRCADMPMIPVDKPQLLNGQPVRNIGPVSVSNCGTMAECFWALRKKACDAKADVVVELVYEPGGASMDGQAARFAANSAK